MNFKIIFFDIDGTLTPNGRTALPSIKVREAIRKASKKVYTSVATGRSLLQAKEMLGNTVINGYSTYASGAQIINPVTEEIISEKLLSTTQLNETLSIYKKYGRKLMVYDNGVPKEMGPDIQRPLSAWTPGVSPDEVREILKELNKIKGINIHTTISWEYGKNDIHISNEKADKYLAITEILKILDIKKEEAMAVGDGPKPADLK